MCPDRQIVSVYLDGELPSPWKEKMEGHLASCESCRALLETYRGVSEKLAECEGAAFDASLRAAGDRLRAKLPKPPVSVPARRGAPLWRRSVRVPLPAAAAAAVFLFILAFSWLRRPAADSPLPEMAVGGGIDLDTGDMIPVADINGVLKYLSARDDTEYVIIQLPESSSFMSAGDPTILKEAKLPSGYSGGTARQ
jgi:hypothetical protein